MSTPFNNLFLLDSAQKFRSLSSLQFVSQSPNFPRVLFQDYQSLPTLALKSPMRFFINIIQKLNHHGGCEYDEMQNCLDMMSHENPLFFFFFQNVAYMVMCIISCVFAFELMLVSWKGADIEKYAPIGICFPGPANRHTLCTTPVVRYFYFISSFQFNKLNSEVNLLSLSMILWRCGKQIVDQSNAENI